MIQLLPILPTIQKNQAFLNNPVCSDVVMMTIEYYKTIGFILPWVGYLAEDNGQLVGSAGYKGAPTNNKIEIAYGTFSEFQNRGIGTQICRQLVELALQTNPTVIITARTLQDNLPSINILKKNGFRLLGIVWDKEDGDVLEWRYDKSE